MIGHKSQGSGDSHWLQRSRIEAIGIEMLITLTLVYFAANFPDFCPQDTQHFGLIDFVQ